MKINKALFYSLLVISVIVINLGYIETLIIVILGTSFTSTAFEVSKFLMEASNSLIVLIIVSIYFDWREYSYSITLNKDQFKDISKMIDNISNYIDDEKLIKKYLIKTYNDNDIDNLFELISTTKPIYRDVEV